MMFCFIATRFHICLTIFFSYSSQTRIAGLCLDSSPLFLRQDKKEVIKTFLKISPSLARNNITFSEEIANKRNETPLTIKVSDYYTDNVHLALRHINSLLWNGSNLFIIARYSELFLDNQGVIDFDVFKNLSIENVLDVTRAELEILSSYIEWGFFTRVTALNYLYKLTGKNAEEIKKIFEGTTITYKRPPITKTDETLILNDSPFLSSHSVRKKLVNPSGHISPIFFIDLESFYGVDLTTPESDETEDAPKKKSKPEQDREKSERERERIERNNAEKARIKAHIQQQTLNYIKLYGQGSVVEGNLDKTTRTVVEEMISSHWKFLKLGKKLQQLIHIELERLNIPKETLLFSRPVVAVGLDSSETKCKFYFEYSKIAEYSEISITLPRIMSYKLGVSKDLDSQKYHKISIGPISLATQQTTGTATGIAHNITSSKQRLSAPIRLFPKLLVVSTDFLSEQSRQAEKDLVFFSFNDMVSFFKVPLKQKELNRQFLAIDTSLTPNQPFYRVHKARTYLDSFKIHLRDECGELLSFARDTIVRINFFFRACNVDRM